MTYEAIAYAYEADVHCPSCTAQRFGPDCTGEDREGNPIHAISPFEEWWDPSCSEREYLVCAGCDEVISAVGPAADAVRAEGSASGRAAQTWLEIDSPEDAARILTSVDDCDPAYDVVPYPLSGEWADDAGPRDILRRFGFRDDDEDSEDAWDTLSRWEDAYREAFEWALVERCREYLKDATRFDRFDIAEAYAVYCHDFNDPRDEYLNRKAAQLRRIGFGPRSTLNFDTLSPNALGIYLSLVGCRGVEAGR